MSEPACQCCLGAPQQIGTVCMDCAVPCEEDGCRSPADPYSVGVRCNAHQLPDNTLDVDEK